MSKSKTNLEGSMSDHTAQGFAFEDFSEKLGCPACGKRSIRRAPYKNFGGIDAVCMACGCGISVKYHAGFTATATFRATPNSKRTVEAIRKLWTDSRLFILAGTAKNHAWYTYEGAKVSEIKPRRGEVNGRVVVVAQKVG